MLICVSDDISLFFVIGMCDVNGWDFVIGVGGVWLNDFMDWIVIFYGIGEMFEIDSVNCVCMVIVIGIWVKSVVNRGRW